MALLLKLPLVEFSAVTPALDGSSICCSPGKYWIPFATYVSFPEFFGKFPTIFGTISVVLAVTVDKPEVMVSGCPEVQLKIPPNCQFSTRRETQPGALESNFRFGPNGRSYVPL